MRRALPLVAVLALAACGGGGGSTRLSHAEFVRQGNRICTDYYKRLKAVPEPKGPDDLVAYVTKAKGYTQDAIDDLAKLKPPADDERSFRSFLAVARREVALEDQLIAAAKAKNMKKVQSLANRGSSLDDRANEHANAAGLTVCGSSGSTG